MQRNQKVCRIVSEFTLYILDHVSNKFSVTLEEIDNKTVIKFVTDKFNEECDEFVRKRLIADRNAMIEEYCWELMGEGDSDDDLKLIGSLVNEIDIVDEGDNTIVTMVRYEDY